MDNYFILLGVMAAALFFAAFQAWRIGNEKRDVALLGAFGGLFGLGAAAVAVI